MAIIKSASVKVILSYDYSHFETSMSIENDDGLTTSEIDDARKACQRLSNKAVEQYKVFKSQAAKREDGKYQMANFETQCLSIKKKNENDRTLKEISMLKQYENENWQAQFDYAYDFDDDENYKV